MVSNPIYIGDMLKIYLEQDPFGSNELTNKREEIKHQSQSFLTYTWVSLEPRFPEMPVYKNCKRLQLTRKVLSNKISEKSLQGHYDCVSDETAMTKTLDSTATKRLSGRTYANQKKADPATIGTSKQRNKKLVRLEKSSTTQCTHNLIDLMRAQTEQVLKKIHRKKFN